MITELERMWKEAVVASLEAGLPSRVDSGKQCKTSFVEDGLRANTLPNKYEARKVTCSTLLSTYVIGYVDHKYYATFFPSGTSGEQKPARNGKKNVEVPWNSVICRFCF